VSLKRGIVTTTTPAGKAAEVVAAGTAASSFLASTGVSAFGATAPLIKAEISSPSFPIMDIKEFLR